MQNALRSHDTNGHYFGGLIEAHDPPPLGYGHGSEAYLRPKDAMGLMFVGPSKFLRVYKHNLCISAIPEVY